MELDISEIMSGKTVNPEVILKAKDFQCKGIISSTDQVLQAFALAFEKTNDDQDEQGNFNNGFSELFFNNLMIYSRSVGGVALLQYGKTAAVRLDREDRKTKINVEGQAQE